ncbi:MAG: cupin domain-containing protein [Bryobacteraceae bacterium]
MKTTRRDLTALLPLLAAAAPAAAAGSPLQSRTWRHDDLTARGNDDKRSRDVFDGLSHKNYPMDMHETELAPGMAPHPPHSHPHHELLILRQGELEVTIEGKVSRIGPGGVVYVASNENHGWKNVSQTRAAYYVIALGRDRG